MLRCIRRVMLERAREEELYTLYTSIAFARGLILFEQFQGWIKD